MKKVAIVSCYFQKNYGSMLQALATQMALDKQGIDNETIDISGFARAINKAKYRYFIKASLTSGFLFAKTGMIKNAVIKKLAHNDYVQQAHIRAKAFQQFSAAHFRLSRRYESKEELSASTKGTYSAVLVGSDQLWLPGNIAADYYTLSWVPDEINTIAYATSFGQSILPRGISQKAASFLRAIKHIGVREENGQKLVKQLTNRNVPVVCDPTLLFTGEDWLSIQKKEPLVEEPYILVYFLGNNRQHREFAKRLRQETGYKIVALLHLDEYIQSDEGYADFTPYNVDPGDFLNLIRHAKVICTDSFHCSVFSILYHKPFFSFRRYSAKTKASTNSRLDSLFKTVGLTDRFVTGNEAIRDCLDRSINYEEVDRRLSDIRLKSYKYLEAALNNEETDLQKQGC